MLIHETCGIVDLFVDDEVEVLFIHTKAPRISKPNGNLRPISLSIHDLIFSSSLAAAAVPWLP